ncbi:hypothetical protein [Flavobacterium luteum]|uniref:GTP-binding protein n=1 Tax=Flavobacterium luteum TaxID=2026654 RepID=A0A7J5AHZ7_9FLAO|nr:hypothetical protein [Flavobacterium luteum]KAB1156629.1 hypothetical protein F6464_04555 [Flavobacterium luteum]
MDTNTTIRLRLRFYKDVEKNIEDVHEIFEKSIKSNEGNFLIKVYENHIWFYVVESKKRIWSPHLHLELVPKSEKTTHIRGLFGPDQTLWTFFMFLHFIIAGTFVLFGMFAYSNFSLKQSYTTDIMVMAAMVIIWFVLYYIAKELRKKGNDQMNEMENLFLKIIK